MAHKFDYTPVLKQKIYDLINDIKHLPEADHAIRELRILRYRLGPDRKEGDENCAVRAEY